MWVCVCVRAYTLYQAVAAFLLYISLLSREADGPNGERWIIIDWRKETLKREINDGNKAKGLVDACTYVD